MKALTLIMVLATLGLGREKVPAFRSKRLKKLAHKAYTRVEKLTDNSSVRTLHATSLLFYNSHFS
ncbi:hypothetical protein [Okeania sp.]|uniref:hypothetical protein n=1 Tax=Okeania sp. TaxID=3100323 RepID=UPI002B4B65D2|nr:hypothetical protein [Okeania sp.]MEB3343722.1 hypothetical protein [Okeania sp.]